MTSLNISPRVSLWLGFAFSLPFSTLTSYQLSFNAYALSLKKAFNLSQTQVEIIASVGAVGYGMGFLESVCTGFLGYQTTCIIVAIGMPASTGLYCLALRYNHLFHSWPSLLYMTHLCLCGTGRMGYFAVTKICVENFPKKHIGKVVGLYLAFSALGKMTFAGLIELFFEENLCGFFLCLLFLSAFLFTMSLWFLSRAKVDKECKTLPGPGTLEATEHRSDLSETLTSTKDMLKCRFFHFLFWSSVMFYGMGVACVNNVTTIAQSIRLDNPMLTVYIMSAVIIVVRVAYGLLFDVFPSDWFGYSLLMCSYTSFGAAVIMCMYFLDTSLILFAAAFIGAGVAPGLIAPLSILLWRFGRHHYSAIAGFFYALSSIVQTSAQIAMGYFYDSRSSEQGFNGRICYGKECFYWPLCIMLVITIVISGVQTLNFALNASKTKNKQDSYEEIK